MHRIVFEVDGHTRAIAVCDLCKVETPAKVWAIIGDYVQVVDPAGWTLFPRQGQTHGHSCKKCAQG